MNVVPVTPAGDIVLVRQWRHGSRAATLEIPGGQVDDGESPAEAAARELWEETGWRAGEVIELGVVNPNPALFANRCFTYLAPDVEELGVPLSSGTEETEVVLVTPDELEGLVAAGEIDHALVIAALFWYERHRGVAGRYPRTRPGNDG